MVRKKITEGETKEKQEKVRGVLKRGWKRDSILAKRCLEELRGRIMRERKQFLRKEEWEDRGVEKGK